MITFEKAGQLWDELEIDVWKSKKVLSPEKQQLKRAHKIFKDVWDNRKEFNPTPGQVSSISKIQSIFGKVDKKMDTPFILGNFKALRKFTQEEIYNNWVEKFTVVHETEHGEATMLTVAVNYANHCMEVYRGERVSRAMMEAACALMFYRSSLGIMLEARCIEVIRAEYKKACGEVAFQSASSRDEGYGIDAVLLEDRTGEELVYVSVKSLNSINKHFVGRDYNKRVSKGQRKLPEVYAGFTDENHHDFKQIVFFYPGRSKEELITARTN